MSRNDSKRLDDIRDACREVIELARRGREHLDADPILWRALERSVEIAGESATRLAETTRDQYPDVDWRGLIGARVVLAHAYHRVEHDSLWEIATVDVPKLAEALGPTRSSDSD